MFLRICYFFFKDDDWCSKIGFDCKNLFWCYYNVGYWFCLFWFLVVVVFCYSCYFNYGMVEYVEMGNLICNNYEVFLCCLFKYKWVEYFDGFMGFWVG